MFIKCWWHSFYISADAFNITDPCHIQDLKPIVLLFQACQVREIFKPIEQPFYLLNFQEFQASLGGKFNFWSPAKENTVNQLHDHNGRVEKLNNLTD